MLWKNTLYFTDYNGEVGESNIYLNEALSVFDVEGFIPAIGAVLSGISTAFLSGAKSSVRFPITTSTSAQPTSSSYDRLFLLFRDGSSYATFTLPAPAASIPLVLSGPYRGFQVDQTQPQTLARLEAIASFLSNTLTPTGAPFPTASWVATIGINPR